MRVHVREPLYFPCINVGVVTGADLVMSLCCRRSCGSLCVHATGTSFCPSSLFAWSKVNCSFACLQTRALIAMLASANQHFPPPLFLPEVRESERYMTSLRASAGVVVEMLALVVFVYVWYQETSVHTDAFDAII